MYGERHLPLMGNGCILNMYPIHTGCQEQEQKEVESDDLPIKDITAGVCGSTLLQSRPAWPAIKTPAHMGKN